MRPRVGQMLASTVDPTAVIVVRCPDEELEITCGGAAMVEGTGPGSAATATADPELMGGSLLGKRYAAEDLGVELLCTKPGPGTLAVNGVALPVKSAKPLPASD
ncbi:hypothetical protein G9272_37315 [Streptomyces asoensis]|uniref:Uncharacterized protein n=1 Tax=Streptomyces asoensis TaxID=249586 RepID=A0A6M4WYV7_9ACTN|nr:hypothetical protein [Streptomyces asoensis]QJT05269.1 hypothetical protein G9272_37315 [Streptomyces asoensis]